MTGRFIISLDCEGKWGMADRISAHHERHLTRDRLLRAYERLLALFARFEIPATFAFVMAFVLTRDERAAFGHLLRDVEVGGRNWLAHFRRDAAAGRDDGWFCPEALEMVAAEARHEIACHGFCHLPLAESLVGARDAEAEIAAARAVAEAKGLALPTFVFPRNLVGHTAALRRHGFIGYRAAAPAWRLPGPLARAGNLAREFDLRERAQAPPPPDEGITVIPSGYFLNWRAGARRLVPPAVTRARWRHILDDAVRRGLTAHLFLHPHNIIDAPGTFDLLEAVVAEAARRRDRGELVVVTQAQWCRDATP